MNELVEKQKSQEDERRDLEVQSVKAIRLAIVNDISFLEKLNAAGKGSREKSLAYTKLQEASMWLGMELRRLADGVSCYPNGNDTSNAIVDPPEPTAAIRKA